MKELVSVRTGNWIDRTSGLSEKSQKYNFSLIVSPALLNSVGVGDDYSTMQGLLAATWSSWLYSCASLVSRSTPSSVARERRGPGIFSHVRDVKGRKVVERT